MENRKMKKIVVSAVAALLLASCGPQPQPESSSEGASSSASQPSSQPTSQPSESQSTVISEPSVPTSESSEEDPDVVEANRVLAMIEALTEESSEEDIAAARAAYDDLTARQKHIVDGEGGLEKLEAIEEAVYMKRDAAAVIALIEALDEEDPNEDDVVAAREAYDAFVAKYGEKGEGAISSELVEKLEKCEKLTETKIINVWTAKAIALDTHETEDLIRFALLSEEIDGIYETLSEEKKTAVSNYAEYKEKKDEIGDYATTFGGGYQVVNTEFAEMELAEDTEFGHSYKADLANANLSGAGNLQFYVPPANLASYDRIAFFASMPLVSNPTFINDNLAVSSRANVAADEWTLMVVDVSTMTKPSDYSVLANYFEDLSQACLDGYKITKMVGLKNVGPVNAEKMSGVRINSQISPDWAYYDEIEDFEHGPLAVADFTAGAEMASFQICWNFIPTVAAGTYLTVEQEIYNPTENTLTDVLLSTITSGWADLESTHFSLQPGWNKLSIPATMFEHTGGAMLTARATSDWAAPGWKFGRIYTTHPSGEVDFGALAINSDFNGYAAFPTTTDPDHGDVVVLDLAAVATRFTVIWNGVPHKQEGAYERVYYWMYNPTANAIDDFAIEAQNTGWDPIGKTAPITLNPGWNKVFLPASMFTHPNLHVLVFNVTAESAPKWAANGWKIGHFIGLEK